MKIQLRMFQMLLCILALSMLSFAQTIALKGAVTDSATGRPVQDVTVSLLKSNKAVATSFSDEKGQFAFKDIPAGEYQLYISLMGYRPHTSQVPLTKSVDVGNIPISNKSITLNTIEVKQSIPPIVIKKDTVEFNATTIKTRPNAVVEELLKRVPGISVDQSGKITAQGETVKRILVDGKPFFGDNVALTTKNLPAEIIDKIQLIDAKSDQAAFSGFDDGKGEKVINITLKKNRRRGTTGNTAIGYGTNERFAASTNINSFNERDRVSVIGGGNNLNDRYFNPGNNFAGSMPGTGLTNTWSGAVNYNLAETNKLRFDASYDVANTHTKNQNTSARQTFLPDTSWYYNQQSDNNNRNTDHGIHLGLNYQIDSSQSLMINPDLSYSKSNNIQQNSYQSLNSNKDTSIIGQSFNSTDQKTPNLNLHALYRKRLKHHGQSFSAYINLSSSTNSGTNTYQTKDNYISPAYILGYDRLTTNNNKNNNAGVRLSYTTHILKDRFLELNYAWNGSVNRIANKTYDIDSLSGKYETPNDSLSNRSNNTFQSQAVGFNLRTNKCGYDYTIGLNAQYSTMNNDNSNAPSFRQRTINLFPTGHLNIKISKGKNLRINYEGNTIRPSADQLQPLPNLSNSLLVKEGNPDLKPSFRHNLNIGYRSFNTATFYGFFTQISSEVITNKIVNINTYDSSGRQHTKPVNANGAFNINGAIANSLSFPSVGMSLGLNSSLSYNRDITFTNLDNKNFQSFTHVFSMDQAANINYHYKSLLDVNTSFHFNYSGNKYATTSNNNITYDINFNYNLTLPAGFIAGNDLRYVMNRGRSAGYNNSTALLNGFVAKSVFKQKQALIKLFAFDLLRQNVSINRNVGDNFIEDVQQTVLRPYWMLSFTWFLKNYPAGKTQEIHDNV